MPVEVRNAIPYLAGLSWTINPLKEAVAVRDSYGREGTDTKSVTPQLVATILTYVAGDQLAPKVYEFTDGKNGLPSYADLFPNLKPVLDAWQTAFDSMLNEFTLTKDQTLQEQSVGLPFYLRLDRWKVNLTPGSPMSVQAIVGIYDEYDEVKKEFNKPVSYKVLTSIDGNTQRMRATTRADLVRVIDSLQPIVDGTADMSQYVKPQEVIDSAKKELPARRAQLAAHDVQEGSLASLGTLLSNPEVQQSIGILCGVLFGVLKQYDPKWASIDVTALLDPEIFKLPDVT